MTTHQQFIARVHDAFDSEQKLTVRELRKFAGEVGLPQDDKNLWELTELAWVLWYRKIAHEKPDTVKAVWGRVVDFYLRVQPTFSARDSTRQIFQQYSTSAPIAWLAGWFTDGGQDEIEVLEPSAGNGLLTIYYRPGDVTVNEIDPTRLENLRDQGFANIFEQDASQPFPALLHRQFEAVLTNPPFGSLGEVNRDYGWAFRKLDHVMVAHALETMQDDGRASIIIGGHTEFDAQSGVIKSGRAFFDWLHRHYRVADMVNIDSPRLYAKQGTTFPLRLILVSGRKAQPFGFAPSQTLAPHYAEVVSDFDLLFERVNMARTIARMQEVTLDDLLTQELEKIALEHG